MSQMTLKKKDIINLGLNPGQLILTVPYLVSFCVAW